MTLWLEVTKDRYEHIINVCDNVFELSRITGASVNNIRSTASKASTGKLDKPRFRRVYVNEE